MELKSSKYMMIIAPPARFKTQGEAIVKDTNRNIGCVFSLRKRIWKINIDKYTRLNHIYKTQMSSQQL